MNIPTLTPRTDSACWTTERDSYGQSIELVRAEHSRELENDLTASLLREKALRKELKDLHLSISCENMDPSGTIWDHADKVQKQLVASQKECDTLASEIGEERERLIIAFAEITALQKEYARLKHELDCIVYTSG